MSKLEWLWRVCRGVLRVSSQPFRTGSWRRRVGLGLAVASALCGSAMGLRYFYFHGWDSTRALADAVATNGGMPRNAHPEQVVPLSVDDEDESSQLPAAPASMFGSRRNPASREDQESDTGPSRDLQDSRPRFGGVVAGPIRTVNNEQTDDTSPADNDRHQERSRFSSSVATQGAALDEPRNGAGEREVQTESSQPDEVAEEVDSGARGSAGSTDSDEDRARGDVRVEVADQESAGSSKAANIADTGGLPIRRPSPNRRVPAPPEYYESGETARGSSAAVDNARSSSAVSGRNDSIEPAAPQRLRQPPSAISLDRAAAPHESGGLHAAESRLESSASSSSPGARHMEGMQSPTIAIEKVAPAEVQVGRPATFQIKVRNLGKAIAHDVVVVDKIPAGTEVIELQPAVNAAADGTLSWDLGNMAPGAESIITIKIMPQREGEIGSVADVTFRAQASVRTMSTRPQVVVRVEGPQAILVGEIAAINVTIQNSGTGAAANLFLDAVIPDGFSHPAGRELQSPLGNLAPGATKTISLPLKAARAGAYELSFSATNESNVAVEELHAIEVTAPRLEVAISGPKTRYLDRQATYAISLANPGTAPADEVELVLFLSKGLKFVSANNRGQYDRQSHAVYWNLERLPADAKGDVQLVLLPIEIGQQKVRAEARGALGLQQTDERVVQVEGLPELQFSVSDTEDPVDVGGETGYEVLIVNKGSQAANNVQLLLEFPGELEPVLGNGTTAIRINGNQAVADPIARLAPNEKAVYKITARAIRAGDSRVRVQIVSDDVRNPVTKEERTLVHADEP